MDGTPQRPPLCLRVSALILGVASLLVPLSALVSTATAQTGFIANGDFEDGLTGWGTTANADASIDSSTGGVAGPSALRVTANTAAVVQLRSHWWLSAQITPGAGYGLEAWILDDSPEVATSLVLEFLDEDGTRIGRIAPTTLPGDSDAYRLILVEGVAPAGATYARAVIEANADAVGASFVVDAVTLAQVAGPPVVTPTVQPSPPPTPAATPGSGAPPKPTATPHVTATPRPITPTLWTPTSKTARTGGT